MKAEHVLSLIKGTRGGKLNDPNFSSRMRGEGRYAELIKQRFALATKRLGFNAEPRGAGLRTDLFERPLRPGDQLRLL
jgi:DNA repair photolyase